MVQADEMSVLSGFDASLVRRGYGGLTIMVNDSAADLRCRKRASQESTIE